MQKSTTKRKRGRPPKSFNMGEYTLTSNSNDHTLNQSMNESSGNNEFFSNYKDANTLVDDDHSGAESSNNGEPFSYDSDKDPGWTPGQNPLEHATNEELEGSSKRFKKSRLKINMLQPYQNDADSAENEESLDYSPPTHGSGINSYRTSLASVPNITNISALPLHPAVQTGYEQQFTSGGTPFSSQAYNYINSMANKRRYNNEERHAFRKGAFLIAKQDIAKLPECPIWRVDGPCLLQKYEPITLNDQQKAFRKTLIFSGWANTTRKNYQSVQIQVLLQVCRTIELISLTEIPPAIGSDLNADDQSEASNDGLATNEIASFNSGVAGAQNVPATSLLNAMTNASLITTEPNPTAQEIQGTSLVTFANVNNGAPAQGSATSSRALEPSPLPSKIQRPPDGSNDNAPVAKHEYPWLREYFDVYIQLLLSTAIHPAFIDMVEQDGDEYFTKPYNKIEQYTKAFLDALTVCSNKRMWDENYFTLMKYFPAIEFGNVADLSDCYACHIKNNKTCKVTFFGTPYNYTTMQSLDSDASTFPNQTIRLCPPCLEMTELFMGLYNLRHKLYQKCLAHVKILKHQAPEVPPTQLLESSLFNQTWKDTVFEDLMSMWDHAHLYCSKFKEFFPDTQIQINAKDCSDPHNEALSEELGASSILDVPPVSVLIEPSPLPTKVPSPEPPNSLLTLEHVSQGILESQSVSPLPQANQQTANQSYNNYSEGEGNAKFAQILPNDNQHQGQHAESTTTASIATLVQTPDGPKLLINDQLTDLEACSNLIMCKDENGEDVLYYLQDQASAPATNNLIDDGLINTAGLSNYMLEGMTTNELVSQDGQAASDALNFDATQGERGIINTQDSLNLTENNMRERMSVAEAMLNPTKIPLDQSSQMFLQNNDTKF